MMKNLLNPTLLLSTLLLAGVAQAETKKEPLQLESVDGVKVEVAYSITANTGNKSFGITANLKGVKVTGSEGAPLKNVEIYLNGSKNELACDAKTNVCTIDEKALRPSYLPLRYQYYAEPESRTDWYLAVKVNGEQFLVDPVRKETVFKLMFDQNY